MRVSFTLNVVLPLRCKMLAFVDAITYTGGSVEYDKALLIDESSGRILRLVPYSQIPSVADVKNLQGLSIAPGFIDVQVNGGGGILFNESPTIEGIRTMVGAHRQFGTTDLLPTFITGSRKQMEKAIKAVGNYVSAGQLGVLGIHLEGPFINPRKAGVHDKQYIREFSEEDWEIIRTLRPEITLLTLAPDVVSSDQITRIVDEGIKVSLGHSMAEYEVAMAAVEAGATGFTHLFNAMSAFQSRAPGMVGAALDSEKAWAGIIVDGFHVHFASVRVALRAKKQGKMFLVTDAMPPVGNPNEDKSFQLGEYRIDVKGGRCVTKDGVLAGSALDMATAARNCVQHVGIPKDEALRMASTYPAQFLGVDNYLGYIAPGYKANLVIFNNQLQVVATVVNGQYQEHQR